MKILVTSANLGGIDTLDLRHSPQQAPAGTQVELIYYTDQNLTPRTNALHPRLQAKIPKMLSHEMHPGYDHYIWLDSSIYMAHHQAIMWLLENLGAKEIVESL